MRPHNLPLVLMGAALLWFGWFGFNGGSALTADGVAAAAVLNTQVAAGGGAARMGDGGADPVRQADDARRGLGRGRRPGGDHAGGRLRDTARGLGDRRPWPACMCHLAVGLKAVFRLDDSLDVAAVHLGGGVVGALSVGLFATKSVNPRRTDGTVLRRRLPAAGQCRPSRWGRSSRTRWS